MLKPSPETLKIRRIVERLSDDDLRAKGPKDLKEAVEKAGLAYDSVREKVNNELARARRKKGIRKGTGRRRAMEWPRDKEFMRQVQLFTELEEFQEKRFKTWAECRDVVEQVLGFLDRFGSAANLMSVIQIKLENEESKPEGAKRKMG